MKDQLLKEQTYTGHRIIIHQLKRCETVSREKTVIRPPHEGRRVAVGAVRCVIMESSIIRVERTPLHSIQIMRGLQKRAQLGENVPFIPTACRLTAASVRQAWHTFMTQGTKPALATCPLLQHWAQPVTNRACWETEPQLPISC